MEAWNHPSAVEVHHGAGGSPWSSGVVGLDFKSSTYIFGYIIYLILNIS
jgi:hypothetical protein